MDTHECAPEEHDDTADFVDEDYGIHVEAEQGNSYVCWGDIDGDADVSEPTEQK